jgi:iron complex transport system substrate-binding protein
LMRFGLVLMVACWLGAAPQRVVSTAPVITEILYALGAGDRVVGVTTYCHYPAEVKQKPKIGTYVKPHMEAILAQRPDLVILIQNPGPTERLLRDAKLNVLLVREGTLENAYANVRTIAGALGIAPRGEALVREMRAGLKEVRAKVAGRPKRSLMFVIGRSPGQLSGMMAVGQRSFLNELFETAGGENVFGGAGLTYPRVTLEEVMARNPEVILDRGDMGQTEGVTAAQKQAVVALYAQHKVLRAVERRAVHAIAADVFMVAGPRVAEAAREIARLLHPEAFR